MIPIASSDCDVTTTFIEDWIAHLHDGGAESPSLVRFFDGPDDAIAFMSGTPSPKKRQKSTHEDLADPDATPRMPPGLTAHGFAHSSADDTSNDTISTSDAASVSNASSRRTGSISPKKRETALRLAVERPLHRDNIANFAEPTQLMVDLASLGSGPLIPVTVKDCMKRDSGWAHPPQDSWFRHSPDNTPGADSYEDELYVYRRLKTVRNNTMRCKARMEHEAGWNDGVHAPLLEIALANESGITYRNITACRVLSPFRESDPFLTDAKVDYAVFLDPIEADCTLAASVRAYCEPNPRERVVCHVQLPDNAPTPAVIPIETKSANADGVLGPVQLATWTRAQFRLLASFPSATALPIIPVIFVHGANWRVDFAQQTHHNQVCLFLVLRDPARNVLAGDVPTLADYFRAA
ncbi:hypothetical protein CH063_08039 [Colletotrichum higginsianum]|uniref:PD-(D/E)XK nuclease-like domain-containing protein n=1 Tax=Colletotrichum higginsianum (strain IMI 349063) TaxID=759273 RepID=H1V8B9_COLHI|nr:hypothetical protein CH063_08039 [Colletotrichum higginsianum]